MNVLHEIIQMPRSASMASLRVKIRTILDDRETSAHVLLPPLICYLRNHTKSQAPGSGSGERNLAERSVVALYEEDEAEWTLKKIPLLLLRS